MKLIICPRCEHLVPIADNAVTDHKRCPDDALNCPGTGARYRAGGVEFSPPAGVELLGAVKLPPVPGGPSHLLIGIVHRHAVARAARN